MAIRHIVINKRRGNQLLRLQHRIRMQRQNLKTESRQTISTPDLEQKEGPSGLKQASSEGLNKKQKRNLQQIANLYYQQASQLTFDNLLLNQKVQQLTEERELLLARLAYYQRENGETVDESNLELLEKLNREENDLNLPKRNRRLATDVKKQFQCPVDKCFKLYGTYAALYLHFKNKHPDRPMKLISHSLNTIKVTDEPQEDQFQKQLRACKQENFGKTLSERGKSRR